jgi:hypothetical protein
MAEDVTTSGTGIFRLREPLFPWAVNWLTITEYASWLSVNNN